VYGAPGVLVLLKEVEEGDHPEAEQTGTTEEPVDRSHLAPELKTIVPSHSPFPFA
jgi:hypothetical protein